MISTLVWALSHGHICTISLLVMPLVISITLTYWTNGTSRTMPNYTASSLHTLICLFLHSTASSTWKSSLCSCVSRIKLLPFLQRFSTFSMMLITSLAIGFIEWSWTSISSYLSTALLGKRFFLIHLLIHAWMLHDCCMVFMKFEGFVYIMLLVESEELQSSIIILLSFY